MGKGNKLVVSVNPVACLTAAFALLIVPLNWLLAAFLAAFLHELCHYSAVRLCGGRVSNLKIGSRGAVMDAIDLSPGKMLFCVLAGPLGPLCLLPLARFIPRIVICIALQSAYNLLPMEPLDGGRALRCCLSVHLPIPIVDFLCKAMSFACQIGIVIVAAWAVLRYSLGIFPVFVACWMIIAANKGKFSCNDGRFAVQ